jgi:hypothetical protein
MTKVAPQRQRRYLTASIVFAALAATFSVLELLQGHPYDWVMATGMMLSSLIYLRIWRTGAK